MEVKWSQYISSSHRFGVVIAIGLALRVLVALHGHSGEGKPPMYGDLEAQRHWMEITVNLPPFEWYHNSSSNDLEYWGLDYPPLSAYHSWLFGKIAQFTYPPLVELFRSRGTETDEAKLFMRLSVFLSELFFVLALWITYLYLLPADGNSSSMQGSSNRTGGPDTDKQANRALVIVAAQYLNPALILVDHGHFQYNHVALAFSQLALIFLAKTLETASVSSAIVPGSLYLSSSVVAYVGALCFKQMSLYFAPAIAVGLALIAFNSSHNSPSWVLRVIGVIVVSVVFVFSLSFFPLLRWDKWSFDLRQVAHRMFPVARGIFEDKVASLWCALDPVLKLRRRILSNELSSNWMLGVCTMCTLVLLAPLGIYFLKCMHKSDNAVSGSPSYKAFWILNIAALISSLAFFLGSFQVHEKTILFALLPACNLVGVLFQSPTMPGGKPYLFVLVIFWFSSTLTLFPLLRRDEQHLPFWILVVFHFAAIVCFRNELFQGYSLWKGGILEKCSFLGLVLLGLLQIGPYVVPQPVARWPDIYPQLTATVGAASFGCVFCCSSAWLLSSCKDKAQ